MCLVHSYSHFLIIMITMLQHAKALNQCCVYCLTTHGWYNGPYWDKHQTYLQLIDAYSFKLNIYWCDHILYILSFWKKKNTKICNLPKIAVWAFNITIFPTCLQLFQNISLEIRTFSYMLLKNLDFCTNLMKILYTPWKSGSFQTCLLTFQTFS